MTSTRDSMGTRKVPVSPLNGDGMLKPREGRLTRVGPVAEPRFPAFTFRRR